MTLNAVFTQVLLPRVGGGLQLALEIMTATPAVKALIRENKIHTIDNQIQLGARYGMQTMNQSLARLVRAGKVMEDDALSVSLDPLDFRKAMME